jgi:branched-chain amino acid transport system substrate-binding protein
MQGVTRTRRPLVRSIAAFATVGAMVAAVAAVGGAVGWPRTSYPGYPTTLSAADIKLAAKYIGGTANKAATGSTITIGFINDSTGTPGFPENVQGAQVAVSFINNKLGGIKGHKLALHVCDALNTDGSACALAMVTAHVKLVLTGTMNTSNDSTMYETLFQAKIPIIQGNDLTSTDFSPPTTPYKGTAVTYMPGSPGVLYGMAKFLGTKGLGSKPTHVTVFYDQGDTGSQTAYNVFFKAGSPLQSKYLHGIAVNGIQINAPWSKSDVESALSSLPAGTILVPLVPVGTCISFAQALTALKIHNTVVTSGLCFGEQVKKALGNYPNGWYFGDYGINYFMYAKALATSQQLAVYIAAVDKYNKTIDYTGFAGPSFGTVLTATKLYIQAGGASATSAKLATLVQKFPGPQWGISGPMTCGHVSSLFFPAICGKYIGISQFKGGKWAPIQAAYNNKLINAFS